MSSERLSTLTLENSDERAFVPEATIIFAGAIATKLWLAHQGIVLTEGSPTLEMDPALLELLAETVNNADAIRQAPNN